MPECSINERIAWAMEPKPKPHGCCDPVEPTEHWLPWDGGWLPKRYDSDYSPRSLLAGVEAEIERRDKWYEYAVSIMRLMRPDGDWHLLADGRIAWLAATAPAAIRAAAAAAVLSPEGER